MPESKKRKKVVQRHAEQARHNNHQVPSESLHSPKWYAPVMVTLAIVGLIIVVAAYVTGGNAPVPGWGNWNLGIGLALIIAGFLMTTGWK